MHNFEQVQDCRFESGSFENKHHLDKQIWITDIKLLMLSIEDKPIVIEQ